MEPRDTAEHKVRSSYSVIHMYVHTVHSRIHAPKLLNNMKSKDGPHVLNINNEFHDDQFQA
jgi:hypothetical protein